LPSALDRPLSALQAYLSSLARTSPRASEVISHPAHEVLLAATDLRAILHSAADGILAENFAALTETRPPRARAVRATGGT